jgi:hypothetical protein
MELENLSTLRVLKVDYNLCLPHSKALKNGRKETDTNSRAIKGSVASKQPCGLSRILAHWGMSRVDQKEEARADLNH